MDISLADATASELADRFRRGEVSPVDALDAVFARIDAVEPSVNAFSLIDREGACVQARASELRWRRGEALSAIDGVPTTVKDLHAVRGWRLGRGSLTTRDDAPAAEDAPCVARLREAGAVLIGATTTPEFGWIGITRSPATGVTRNPWNTALSAGGSSGGAAAAAAAGMAALHTGSDALGSIRIPAAFCGVVGLKPTYGRVPSYPSSVMGSLSHTGPLARSVRDAALMLDVVSRPDARDWSALPACPEVSPVPAAVRGMRAALAERVDAVTADDHVLRGLHRAAGVLEAAGAVVEPVTLDLAAARPVAQLLWEVGCAALAASVPESRRADLDPGLQEVAERGLRHSAVDLRRAEFERDRLAREVGRLLSRHEILVLPTLPILPFPAEADRPSDPRFASWLDWDCACFAFNVTQHPAISLPVPAGGTPVGVQIVGRRHADATVLRAAAAVEAAVPRLRPRLTVSSSPDLSQMPAYGSA